MTLPASTYRLQLHEECTLRDARDLVGYLDALGVSTLYTSPIWRSRPGSPHGYDVTDPRALRPELGSPDDLAELARALGARGMTLLCDIIPNHMAAHPDNAWWWDVLTHGRASRWARFFDIDWRRGGGKIVLPVLGRPYREALERGELEPVVEHGRLVLRYHEHRFPLRSEVAGADRSPEALTRLHTGTPGQPETFNALDRLLRRQAYRLAWWRTGEREGNYRRFFDIASLVGVRVEDPGVFDAVHDLWVRLVRHGIVQGLRVDHVDGLRDPGGYLERLRRSVPGAYIVVEKILARDEELPSWACDGTTGYEYLNAAGGLCVHPSGAHAALRTAARFTGEDRPFSEVAYEKKRLVLERLFSGEVDALARTLRSLASRDPHARDIGTAALTRVLVETTACLSVYRTYTRSHHVAAADRRRIEQALRRGGRRLRDHRRAFAFLRRVLLLTGGSEGERRDRLRFVLRWQQLTGPAMAKGFEDTALYACVGIASRNEVGGDPAEPAVSPAEMHRRNTERLARAPGSLNATSTHDTKRGEDVRARIDVLTEIPDRWAAALDRWRRMNHRHATRTGGGRVPDPNMELLAYQTLLGFWPATPAGERGLGRRLREYLCKAAREAKSHTSWRDPDPAYENALARFATRIVRRDNEPFRSDFDELHRLVAHHGMLNSLSQVALKIAAPGVPDLYQGCELWHLRLVDPDNREPVGFTHRHRMLQGIRRRADADPVALAGELLAAPADGRLKLFVTHRALAARRRNPDLFGRGRYVPLEAAGTRRAHIFAFARHHDARWAVAMVPRLTTRVASAPDHPLGACWKATTVPLPAGAPRRGWRNVLTDEAIGTHHVRGRDVFRAAQVFAALPVALLVNDGGQDDGAHAGARVGHRPYGEPAGGR